MRDDADHGCAGGGGGVKLPSFQRLVSVVV